MEQLDIVQLMNKDDFKKAHDHLLNCGWEITGFGSRSVLYKKKKDKLTISSDGDNLLFKINNEEAKELTEDNLIRTILF